MDPSSKRATEQLIDQLRAQGIRDERVLAAMAKLDRRDFVDTRIGTRAYEDEPQSIGFGQTISQPYVVARMTEALALSGDERVLEVGTGSAYQTAVLARMCREVYSVEIVPSLYRAAVERLAHLELDNVRVGLRSGEYGWAEAAPFDAIIVTAAPLTIPPALVAQLAPGGRLVIPIGPADAQELIRATKDPATGELSVQRLLPVRFVPLVPAIPSA